MTTQIGIKTNIDFKTSFKLCRVALKRSESDIYTWGPMNLVIVRKEGIFSHGKKIKSALELAENNEFERIIEEEMKRTAEANN